MILDVYCLCVFLTVVDFFNQINILYGTLTEFCTDSLYPTMCAGPKHDQEGASLLLSKTCSNRNFIGVPFPRNFPDVVKIIFKRLFRIYAHIYHSHFQNIVGFGEEVHLNTCFKHFVLFTWHVASKSNDPQTLRMVAGAIANLCGNQKLHEMLIEDDGIKALLGMAQCGNSDVIAQVARGLANFAKCESRATVQGYRSGRSLLMEDGALSWLIANSIVTLSSTRRHIELAICHLAQNDDNAQDFISTGAAKELSRISSLESSREDIRNLAKKTLAWNPNFQVLMREEVHVSYLNFYKDVLVFERAL
ncbi:hypothetical protein GIB67_032714, partial [Kingdonia uniflora]